MLEPVLLGLFSATEKAKKIVLGAIPIPVHSQFDVS